MLVRLGGNAAKHRSKQGTFIGLVIPQARSEQASMQVSAQLSFSQPTATARASSKPAVWKVRFIRFQCQGIGGLRRPPWPFCLPPRNRMGGTPGHRSPFRGATGPGLPWPLSPAPARCRLRPAGGGGADGCRDVRGGFRVAFKGRVVPKGIDRFVFSHRTPSVVAYPMYAVGPALHGNLSRPPSYRYRRERRWYDLKAPIRPQRDTNRRRSLRSALTATA